MNSVDLIYQSFNSPIPESLNSSIPQSSLSLCSLTTSTGIAQRLRTRRDVLPIVTSASPPLPCEPMTIKSASISSA